MGKVEKVIVLSVLFLVALILVVTVTVDDPLDKAKVVEAGGKQAAPTIAQAPTPPPASAQPLLNANVTPNQAPPPAAQTQAPVTPPAAQTQVVQQPGAAPAAAPAATLPPGALLKKTDGLQDSWFSDLKLYTWKEGDTWRGLAHTYYGDWQRLDVLKRHNEGRMNVAPGETVFIPVFADERGQAAEAARLAAASGTAGAPTQPAATDGKAPTTAAETPKGDAKSGGKKLHVVLNGESLWKIAKAELGDGNRWKEIYEANRDVLDKPESIRKGMRLRIP